MDDRRRLVWCHARTRRQVSCRQQEHNDDRVWHIWRKIAQHLAEVAAQPKDILIDCFAGVGGNVIAFAQSKRWTRVYAIEKDSKALACAKHNAEIYGVQDKISWYEGDCFELLRNELADLGERSVIFASPPWGGELHDVCLITSWGSLTIIGPSYRSDQIFDLTNMQPYSLLDLLDPFRELTSDVALYLPRTSDIRQLARQGNDNGKTSVTHYCMQGASKVGGVSTAWANNTQSDRFVGNLCVLWGLYLLLSNRSTKEVLKSYRRE